MDELKPCPICGSKAFVMHDVVDGFEFGWSAGCPRFKLDDGIHDFDSFIRYVQVAQMTSEEKINRLIEISRELD